MSSLTAKNIAKIIDQTNINPKATEKDIIKTCKEALNYGFRGVCVLPKFTSLTAELLAGSGIKTVVLIDAPLGLSPHSQRLALCEKAKREGADELDIVMNIIDMKYEYYDDILTDLKELCSILPSKVIIGSGYLTDQEIKKASELVRKSGAFCIKTSTAKDPLERIELKEKARHIQIIKKVVPDLKIKAAGNIRTFKDAKMMIEAGADIIGTSSAVQILTGQR